MAQNPAWQFDELVLALDLYFREPGARNSKVHPALVKASDSIRALPLGLPRPSPETFRNVNSVYLKLQNFKAIDPEYIRDGRKGMRAGAGPREQALWARYSADPAALASLARQITEGVSADSMPSAPEEDEEGVMEGRLLFRMHRSRERDSGLVKKKKAGVLKSTGRLACEGCDLDFEERYGPIGHGFIECHHNVPLHAAGERATLLADLSLVCANCHRMLHRSAEVETIAELRRSLRA